MTAPKIFELAGKRIFVAGHRGMVGSAIVRHLEAAGHAVLSAPRAALDLRRQERVEQWFEAHRPDVVVLAAGKVGGIGANASQPVEFLLDNLLIEANVIGAAHRSGVQKLLFLGSSCIYPKFADQPIAESALLTGPLEPTNQWYAIAKIAGLKLAEAFRVEHGCDFISVMPTNLYGPGDNFEPAAAHVLPALLRRAHEAAEAGAERLVVWGSGAPLREMMYVDDLADACVFLLERYSGATFLNAGSGEEFAIADLARKAAAVAGFAGEIVFDASKPDGTPRKRLDTSALAALGWRPKTPFDEGLARTYAWFKANRATLRG